MAYFPVSLQLSGKKILLVGAGNIAYKKLSHLLEFSDNIFIVASKINLQIKQLIEQKQLSFAQRKYKDNEIQDYDIVVVAVDNLSLQKKIYEEAQHLRCLCNCVDSLEYCDFIFPAYIKKDKLTIAISTSGASPSFAKHFKEYLCKLIPDDVGTFLDEMQKLRKELPKGKQRMQMFDTKVKTYLKTWRTT